MESKTPQLEDGFIRIATEIWEALGQYRLSGEEWLVLNCILRKTYGWHKKKDKISFSQFAKYTGLKRQNVLRALKKLSSKKIIAVIKKDDNHTNSYCFNKQYHQWSSVIKKDTTPKGVIKKDDTLSSKKMTKVSSKKIHTIDKKDTITKDKERPHKKLKYLLNIPDKDIPYLEEELNINSTDIKRKAKELYNYCEAKGKSYKNYRAFLKNALIKDFDYTFKT